MARQAHRYRVFFTPLLENNEYGSEVEVSDRVEINGISKITRNIDDGDYDYGQFAYGDISLKGYNAQGFFSDENDHRGIFSYTRDRCKVRVVWIQTDTAGDGDETTTITFRGLINEEATREDPLTEQIKFRVLSRDSVIRTTKVAAGAVSTGNTVSTAIKSILTTPRINAVLTVSSANINPDLDITIDDGSKFDNKPTREAINELLFASNSVMLIDDSDNVIVRNRLQNETRPIITLFGPHDMHNRENIQDLKKFNTGFHRTFSSVNFNGTVKTDSALETEFGVRQKQVTIDWITDGDTEADIATRLLRDFKAQKIECEVTVETNLVKDTQLLDLFSVNFPLRLRPPAGKFLPIVGITKIDDADFPLPDTFGALKIAPNVAFKVIRIDENPKTFYTTLKLRQIGTNLSDGFFNNLTVAIVGFAIVGESVLTAETDLCKTWNPSVAGAAQLGCTKVA